MDVSIFTISGTYWNLWEPCYNSLMQSDSVKELKIEVLGAKPQRTKSSFLSDWGKGICIFTSSMSGFVTELGLSPHYVALI